MLHHNHFSPKWQLDSNTGVAKTLNIFFFCCRIHSYSICPKIYGNAVNLRDVNLINKMWVERDSVMFRCYSIIMLLLLFTVRHGPKAEELDLWGLISEMPHIILISCLGIKQNISLFAFLQIYISFTLTHITGISN